MARRNFYIGISIILVVLALFFISNNLFDITGRLGSVYTTCEDTDKGDDKYIKGTLTYIEYGRESKYVDYCFARTGKGPKKWVKEYYCDLNERMDAHDYNCELYGTECVDGACIEGDKELCVDSDGGLNYDVKGETCVNSDCKTDLCIDKVRVSERYCKNETNSDSKIHTCENECVNGICVKAKVVEEEVVEEEEIVEEVPAEKESFGKIIKKFFCKIIHPTNYEKYEVCAA